MQGHNAASHADASGKGRDFCQGICSGHGANEQLASICVAETVSIWSHLSHDAVSSRDRLAVVDDIELPKVVVADVVRHRSPVCHQA